jgi:hypothetical protein
MSGKPLHDAAPIVGMLCLLAGVVLIAAYCGCVDPKTPDPGIIETASNAAVLAEYKLAVRECRKKAVAAKDIAVFDTCADDVDARFCASYGYACDGGAR